MCRLPPYRSPASSPRRNEAASSSSKPRRRPAGRFPGLTQLLNGKGRRPPGKQLLEAGDGVADGLAARRNDLHRKVLGRPVVSVHGAAGPLARHCRTRTSVPPVREGSAAVAPVELADQHRLDHGGVLIGCFQPHHLQWLGLVQLKHVATTPVAHRLARPNRAY